jgi:transcription-repair coupling factor (superfamily II helicase)
VLTLTATPIPRTLQLALSGVRELSLITTPPVDRLAVRTYISPFDPVIIREALRRERYRGGRPSTWCRASRTWRMSAEFLAEADAGAEGSRAPTASCPEHARRCHDRLLRRQVRRAAVDCDRGVRSSTSPTPTPDRASRRHVRLAQLYQLRGRVGRSKARAYAYFTTPAGQRLTEGAEKRLKVLQSLDTLGAGFSLASHDMDIRGAGNLLGEEQSGHINEVGFELYQSMLEEAVAALKGGDLGETQEQWSPQISLGTSGADPGELRRRSAVAAGPLPAPLHAGEAQRHRRLRRGAGGPLRRAAPGGQAPLRRDGDQGARARRRPAQVDAGPKGAVIGFRKNQFANPEGSCLHAEVARRVRLQADHKLVFKADWPLPEDRLRGVRALVRQLADVAGAAEEGGVGCPPGSGRASAVSQHELRTGPVLRHRSPCDPT